MTSATTSTTTGRAASSAAAHDLSDTNPLLEPSGLQSNGGRPRHRPGAHKPSHPRRWPALQRAPPPINVGRHALRPVTSADTKPDWCVRPRAYSSRRPGPASSGRSAVLDAFALNATSVRFLLFGRHIRVRCACDLHDHPKALRMAVPVEYADNGSQRLVRLGLRGSNAAGTTTFSSGVRVKVNNSKLPSSDRERRRCFT